MCWISENKPVQYIAESRIPVYKIMTVSGVTSKTLRSFYRETIYNLDTKHVDNLETPTLEKPIRKTIKPIYRIYIGIHSYSTSDTVCIKCGSYLTIINKKTKEKLDAYLIPYLEIFPTTSLAKVSGYIPVNAKYYINKYGECVSNKIVLTDIEKYTRS